MCGQVPHRSHGNVVLSTSDVRDGCLFVTRDYHENPVMIGDVRQIHSSGAVEVYRFLLGEQVKHDNSGVRSGFISGLRRQLCRVLSRAFHPLHFRCHLPLCRQWQVEERKEQKQQCRNERVCCRETNVRHTEVCHRAGGGSSGPRLSGSGYAILRTVDVNSGCTH